MSSRDVRLYITDILDAIEKIQRYTDGFSFQAFAQDAKTIDAVVRNIVVIGEAATNIPDEVKTAHPDIPWKEIVGMRNKIVHEYFGVDDEILWKTITDDLTCLEGQVRSLLPPDAQPSE